MLTTRPKPKKLFIVPVNISDPPQDDKASIDGYATMMAIEPDVVRKLYMRDTTPRVLPSDLHPDQVDYVSLQSTHEFAKLVANHPKWSTLVSKKQSRTKNVGKRSRRGPMRKSPRKRRTRPKRKRRPRPRRASPRRSAMTEFVAAGATSGTQDVATVSPVASPSERKKVKKTAPSHRGLSRTTLPTFR